MPTKTASRRPAAADLRDVLMAIATADTEIDRRTGVYPQALEQLLAAETPDPIPHLHDPRARLDALLEMLRGRDNVPTPVRPVSDANRQLDADVILPPSVEVPIAQIATTLAAIEDRRERIILAQHVVQATRYRLDQAPTDDEHPERYELIRFKRDIATAQLLAPYSAAQKRARARQKQADDDLAAGRIAEGDYARLTEQIRKDMAADLRQAEAQHGVDRVYKPTAVANLIGVSRGLVTSRIRPRTPEDLPGAPLKQAEVEACRYATLVHRYTVLQRVAELIRNDALDDLLTGNNPDGVQLSNSEVQRLTGHTSARISQLRHNRR
jgi:hypothetical protein